MLKKTFLTGFEPVFLESESNILTTIWQEFLLIIE